MVYRRVLKENNLLAQALGDGIGNLKIATVCRYLHGRIFLRAASPQLAASMNLRIQLPVVPVAST